MTWNQLHNSATNDRILRCTAPKWTSKLTRLILNNTKTADGFAIVLFGLGVGGVFIHSKQQLVRTVSAVYWFKSKQHV